MTSVCKKEHFSWRAALNPTSLSDSTGNWRHDSSVSSFQGLRSTLGGFCESSMGRSHVTSAPRHKTQQKSCLAIFCAFLVSPVWPRRHKTLLSQKYISCVEKSGSSFGKVWKAPDDTSYLIDKVTSGSFSFSFFYVMFCCTVFQQASFLFYLLELVKLYSCFAFCQLSQSAHELEQQACSAEAVEVRCLLKLLLLLIII